jgi:hypothetical protein
MTSNPRKNRVRLAKETVHKMAACALCNFGRMNYTLDELGFPTLAHGQL